MTSIRESLVAQLRAVVGPESAVHIIPYQDNADLPDRPTVMFKQQTIAPLPQAPRGGLRVDFILTFIAPEVDPSKAEERLDTWVPETMADMTMPWLVWSEAQKVIWGTLNTAYDVSVSVIATPVNAPLPAKAPAAAHQTTPAPAGGTSSKRKA